MGNKSSEVSLKNVTSQIVLEDDNKQLMQYVFTQKIRISDQANIFQAIKDQNIQNLQFQFELRCYSIIQGVNYQDQSKYQNSLHLAFELSKQTVIEYFFALKQCQKLDDRILLLKDYRGQDIYDICIDKGDYLVKYLIKFQIQTYSQNIINYCLKKQISLDNDKQAALKQIDISKFNLKQEFESIYFGYEDNQINYNQVIKKYPNFKLFRISEILNIQIQSIQLFPQNMLSNHINQSPYLGNCYLISTIRAAIKSNNLQLIYNIFMNQNQNSFLSFSGKSVLNMYKEGKKINIEVDDRFLYNIKLRQSYASEISIHSVYFNILEKAWIKKLGGYLQDFSYPVDFCMIDLFNIPVISIVLNGKIFFNSLKIIKTFINQQRKVQMCKLKESLI